MLWRKDGCCDMDSAIQYILDNLKLIKDNLGVFILGWSLFLGIGYAISSFIHSITDEKWKQKYDQLSEDYKSIENDYLALKKVFDEDDLVVFSGGNGKTDTPLSTKMSKSLKDQK